MKQTDGRTGGRADGMAPQPLAIVTLVVALLSACPPVRPSALLAQVPAATPQAPAAPQQSTGPQLIDRIVAVVGERAVLLSEIDEKINDARSQGLQVPTDTAQLELLRRQMLTNIIDEEVIYQYAHRDTSITVTDPEVQTAVDQQYQQVRNQFHSEAEFRTAIQQVFGTVDEYRRKITESNRRQAYIERFIGHQRQEGKLRPGTVSEADLRRSFEELRTAGRVGRLPPTITFRQVVVSPRPTAAERVVAYARADSIRLAIEHGADFAAMARRFSQDPTSRDSGGALGWFRRGQMVRAFEETAFQLRPGVPSPVVQTEYGYHVIQVDRVQPGQVKARHILIAAAVSDSERAGVRRLADSVAVLMRAGVSADSLAKKFGDSGEVVVIGPTDRTQLPPGYAEAMANAQTGQLVGPTMLNPETPDRPRYLVATVTDVQVARDPTFEDKREDVRAMMLDQRGIQNLVGDLKKQTYVSVRL